MEILSNIITSGKALNIVLLAVLLYVLIRSKFLSIKTEHITLGAHEDERAIMRRQLEYVRIKLNSVTRDFPVDLNKDKTENVIHNICNLFEDMIVFNHIKADKEYIGIKQSLVYDTVLSLTDHKFFTTDEFRTICDDTVDTIIKKLVSIRTCYR